MIIRRVGAWAGPVTGIAAVLCATIAIAYASGTRVAVSIPAAANIGGPTVTATSSGPAAPLPATALTVVHPTHPVEVLDRSDDASATTERPTQSAATPGVPRTTERDDDAATPDDAPSHTSAAAPTVAPTPSVGTGSSPSPQPTDTWSDDDPSRGPSPSPSQWRPTGTPSWSPSGSHSDNGGDDDSADNGTGGASQSDS